MMSIQDMKGVEIRDLRHKLRMTQRDFWGQIGTFQHTGSRYENEQSDTVPHPVRILVYIRYVLGIEFNETPAGLRKLRRLAKLQREDCPEISARFS